MKHIKEFRIKANTKKPGKKNLYEIKIRFMIGDADGYETELFSFTENQMNDTEFRELVSDFVDSINACIKLDNNGRVGFDECIECTEWYAGGFDRCKDQYEGVPSWSRFCRTASQIEFDNEEEENDFKSKLKMVPLQESDYRNRENPFIYDLPTDQNGYFCSYDNISMYYYDSNGEKFEVDTN